MNSWHIPGRYDFSIPEAQRLSDLSGIDNDLEAVVRICTRCEKLMIATREPTEVDGLAWWEDVQALGDLTFATVVKYGRTFGNGVRQSIPREWISLLPTDQQESHTYFKALRDKYVAHSVSQLEDNQVFVMLTSQLAEAQECTHTTVDRGRLIALDLSDVRRLAALAEALRKLITAGVEFETSRLLKLARSMPIAEITSRDVASAPIPGKAEVFKPQKKF